MKEAVSNVFCTFETTSFYIKKMCFNRFVFYFLFCFVFSFSSFAKTMELKKMSDAPETIFLKSDTLFVVLTELPFDSIIHTNRTDKEIRKERLVAAIAAFPFPFGFMGAHRVMLGTSPWIPVIYVATFGGCFGLLPLIDFFVITFSKDIEPYENNPHVFMWVK
jgi:TM2 domain-containing membrane protein YozV